LWTETSTQPRLNTACQNQLTTTKKILVPDRSSAVPIRIVAFANGPLTNSDTVVVTISNKAQISSASTQLNCPTELTNTISLTSSYTVAGPTQNCFPVQGNPSVFETAFRVATQTSSSTYTGQWRFRITNAATCIAIVSVTTSSGIGQQIISSSCNRQSSSIPNPWPGGQINVFRGQTLVLEPPNFGGGTVCQPIPRVTPEIIRVNYFVWQTNCTNIVSPGNSIPCSGDYEISLEINSQPISTLSIAFVGGHGTAFFTNVIINSSDNVTITIDCV
jgi:hypothetical protein